MSEKKLIADGKFARGRTKILIDSARKKTGKKFLRIIYNKTRINIGDQHDRWMELKATFIVQTHAEV